MYRHTIKKGGAARLILYVYTRVAANDNNGDETNWTGNGADSDALSLGSALQTTKNKQ